MYISDFESLSGLGRERRRRGVRRIGQAVRRASFPAAAIAAGAAVPAAIPSIARAAQARAERRAARRASTLPPVAPLTFTAEETGPIPSAAPAPRADWIPPVRPVVERLPQPVPRADWPPPLRPVFEQLPSPVPPTRAEPSTSRLPFPDPDPASPQSPASGGQWLVPALIVGGVALLIFTMRQ